MFEKLYKKYYDVIPYITFGALTTIINWVAYKVFFDLAGITNIVSTILAWLLAVIFAFFTNKIWVFKSKSFAPSVVTKEVVRFFSARILSGILDVVIMWLTVDMLNLNADIWKMISNFIVIVINYIASKFIIFKK